MLLPIILPQFVGGGVRGCLRIEDINEFAVIGRVEGDDGDGDVFDRVGDMRLFSIRSLAISLIKAAEIELRSL